MASGFQSLRLFRLRKKKKTHNPLYGVPNLINSYCLDVGLLPLLTCIKVRIRMEYRVLRTICIHSKRSPPSAQLPILTVQVLRTFKIIQLHIYWNSVPLDKPTSIPNARLYVLG